MAVEMVAMDDLVVPILEVVVALEDMRVMVVLAEAELVAQTQVVQELAAVAVVVDQHVV
jgi:hypothetical protein